MTYKKYKPHATVIFAEKPDRNKPYETKPCQIFHTLHAP